MSSTTSRLGLYKPAADGSEFSNVVTDLNNNLDKIDSSLGAVPCSSGTRPTTPFLGMLIRETDTLKMYVCTGTGPSVWTQIPVAGGGTFDSGITLSTGDFTANAGLFASIRATAATLASQSKVTGDAQQRYTQQADGKMLWGPGNAAGDANFYRLGVGSLKTDTAFTVGTTLNVLGSSNLVDANLSGNLNIGSARYRNGLSSQTSILNTVTTTTFSSVTLPANDATAGAAYRIKAFGQLSVAAATTPTIAFRLLAGTNVVATFPPVTIRSGATDGYWEAEALVVIQTTGASGNVTGYMKYTHNFTTSAITYTPVGPIVGNSIVFDTTVSNTFALQATWGTASASNVLTCRGFAAERVA